MINGIELSSRHKLVDKTKIKNIGFIIAKSGEGTTLEPEFTNHIQTASDVGVPLVALFKPDINDYVYRYQGLTKDWNPNDDAQLLALKRSFYSGEAKRKVHGCIIDLTDIAEGNVLASAGWVRKVGEHLSHYIWNWFKVPTYIYITAGVVNAYPAQVSDGQTGVSLDSQRVLETYLSNLDGLCTQKMGVFQSSADDPILFSWDNFPAPPATYNPSTERIFSNKIYFSKYSNTKGGFDGITDEAGKRVAVPLWVWMGNESSLYGEENLNFAATPTNPPVNPPVDDGEDEGEIPDEVVYANLEEVVNQLIELNKNIKVIGEFFKKFQGE